MLMITEMIAEVDKVKKTLETRIAQGVPLHVVYFDYIQSLETNKALLTNGVYDYTIEILSEFFVGVIHATNILVTKSEHTSPEYATYYVRGINHPKFINNYYAHNAILWDLFDRIDIKGERCQEILLQTELLKVTFQRQLDNSQREQNKSCYIATMVYGDVDHYKVEILRQYRDTTLKHSFLGKAFIRFYYKISPTLVKYLEGVKPIENVFRRIIDIIVDRVK